MVKAVIVDYGIGNVKSLYRSLVKVGAEVEISADKQIIQNSDVLLLPGVGAFDPAMKKLAPLAPLVFEEIKRGKPMLGICLGMQLLFSEGEEGVTPGDPLFKGLDIVPGVVRLFPKVGLKIPHMGWNSIQIMQKDHPLYIDIPQESYVYFVHSFYGDARKDENILTKTDYGIQYASSVGEGNVFGTQFHPEKSGGVGLKILSNFLNYSKK